MGPGVDVRRIEAADFAAVAALLAELGRPRLAPGSEAEAGARDVYLRHVADPDAASLIAERGGLSVGFLSLHFRDRLNHATPEAWIPDLIVTAAEHGRGAAVALFDRAVELARERGCHRLTLESGHHRQRAHRFYAREGMTDGGKWFYMDL